MKLLLTDKPSGKELVVDSDAIKILEPDAEGTGTHIVFGADLGRVVVESLPQIANAIGVTVPKTIAAASVLSVAKKK